MSFIWLKIFLVCSRIHTEYTVIHSYFRHFPGTRWIEDWKGTVYIGWGKFLRIVWLSKLILTVNTFICYENVLFSAVLWSVSSILLTVYPDNNVFIGCVWKWWTGEIWLNFWNWNRCIVMKKASLSSIFMMENWID